jgi:glyoxylate reductase
VVVVGALPAVGVELLRQRLEVDRGDVRPERSWLDAHVPGAAAIVADPGVPIDAELLDAAGTSLKVVANFAVGHDNIDLEAVRARGIRATNTPDVLTNATAELAITLMLAAARRVAEADALTRRGEWHEEEELLGRELAGATVGLVGFGRIARRVAGLLSGFEVRLLFTARSRTCTLSGSERRELDDLLASSDFVSLHVPLTPRADEARRRAREHQPRRRDRHGGAGRRTSRRPAGRGGTRRLRGRAARAARAARASQHGAPAAHRFGHRQDEGGHGASLRRQRDRGH